MYQFTNSSKESCMKNQINITNREQLLNQLSRESVERQPDTILSSPGEGAVAWLAKIQSNSSYNIYNVVSVELDDAGSEPVTTDMLAQAINIAEPFDQQGTLANGTYVVIYGISGNYVFHVES